MIGPRTLTLALITVALCGGLVFYFMTKERSVVLAPVVDSPIEQEIIIPNPQIENIGYSVEGRAIESYTFGTADVNTATHLLFVGGIHGGYEWNSVSLAYKFIDHITLNPSIIPEEILITIIPSANPDGLYKVVGKEGRFLQPDIPAGTDESIGRFNANGIDLNRNFACKWKPESSWRGNTVSAGTSAFSEPEARAIRDFILTQSPEMVAFWHSQGNTVYASECENGILPETLSLMNTYATASGYSAIPSFDAYEISGDAEGWLASIGIPAITVELKTHETIEWEENLNGIKALINKYSQNLSI